MILSDFAVNITSQYRPAIIIQASIDHRSNIDSQHWLPTLRAWTDHRRDHIFLHGFCFLKMRSTFFKEGKSNFFDSTWTEITEIISSTLCIKSKIFPFILFENRRLAQGIRRPKAANSPLITFYSHGTFYAFILVS